VNWLSTHKHLVITLIVSVVFLFCYYKWVAHADGVAHDERVLAEAKLKQDETAQKAADERANQAEKAYELLKTQMDGQNAALRGQITALTVALAQRQTQDRALPPPELADRHIALIGGVPGDVKATSDGILATLGAERQTVVLLEELPADRQTIKNQETIIGNGQKTLESLQRSWNTEHDAKVKCETTQASMKKACDDRIDELKADNRKHNLFFSIVSFLAGALLGHRI
jgi:hypothetical protein